MKIKYDLIIIGCTKSAFSGAEYAVKLGARIAIVLNTNFDDYFLVNFFQKEIISLDKRIKLSDYLDYQKQLILEKNIPDLELLGVDIINSKCEFRQDLKQNIYLLTNRDELYSSSYILAMNRQQFFNINPSLCDNNDSSIEQLILQKKLENLTKEFVIDGEDIINIFWLNKLIELEKNISLICPSSQILTTEDEDISYQLQLFFEAQGVKIYKNYPEFDRTFQENQSSKIIIRNYTKKLDKKDSLGLEKLGIKNYHGRIKVNQKLQTSHQKIYVIGELLGGYPLDSVTESEIKIAVNNSLFVPYQEIDYSNIPYSLPTNPPINRIGYTEKQAIAEKIKVLKVFINLESSINLQQNYMFMKIILDNQNYILGVHSFGFIPEELITTLYLIKNKNLPFNYLFESKFSNINSYIVVKKIVEQWKLNNPRQNQIILDLAETFLIWKRS